MNKINQGGIDGFINISVSGGVPLYNFEWYLNGEFFSSNQNIATTTAGDYTIRVTDSNNCTVETTIMMVVGLKPDLAFGESIRVYPNPAKDQVHIEMDLKEKAPVSIIVFDPLGRRVINLNGLDPATKRHTINLNNQANGLYLLKIIAGDRFATRKIIRTNE